jgi:type IV pilus assembly protein PilA
MKKKSTIVIRAKRWIGPSFATMSLCLLVTACRARYESHETSAINTLKAIYSAEVLYQTTYPAKGFSFSLQDLGGDPAQGPATSTSAQLLQGDLPTGSKDGYLFKIANCTKVTVHGVEVITGYSATALPQKISDVGTRGFCMDQSGEIKIDPAGGANCTESLH